MIQATACSPLLTRWQFPFFPRVQLPGEVFVFGDGDCGQLGLGEDITERLRPFPVDVAGTKVGCPPG